MTRFNKVRFSLFICVMDGWNSLMYIIVIVEYVFCVCDFEKVEEVEFVSKLKLVKICKLILDEIREKFMAEMFAIVFELERIFGMNIILYEDDFDIVINEFSDVDDDFELFGVSVIFKNKSGFMKRSSIVIN